jgi:hypothetical protein
MTCQCDCTNVGLANRRCFIAGLACTAISPMAANAQLAGPPTAEDVTFMRMAIEEARLARISEGASQSWCSPAGEGPARVSPSKAPGSK